ncbi:MAG TPA: aminotransferase class V-fold PLP-dependent enzyme, partial [Candidatus Aminicenantes bacterium]|nr:aminotransferase class V-fold PLP-dependent enzyme [Candidatus Aminicenantes bacterium]
MNRPLPEPIFLSSRPGKVGSAPPKSARPDQPLRLDAGLVRDDIAGFPEVSEVELVRHYTALSHLNYSVDEGLYPLGSCTMKYNPKINEKVAAFDGFNCHPYAPLDTVQGNLAVIHALQEYLVRLTGMAGFTTTPAAGAHGEFTGMLTLRRALERRGNPRKVVLIPDSAHGTNPASAHFAGYEVKTISSGPAGTLELETVRANLNEDVAALMMTNPNTLGVFETDIVRIAELLHQNGSLLYMDGANFNALIGVVRPGDLGVDVLHLNLHKTFATPHGGG